MPRTASSVATIPTGSVSPSPLGGTASVAAGVTLGASVAVDAASTTTEPCMVGWIVHTYAKVPAVSKVTLADCPPPTVPVSKAPPEPVAVWPTPSPFSQVTESPTSIVTVAGSNAKPLIATV